MHGAKQRAQPRQGSQCYRCGKRLYQGDRYGFTAPPVGLIDRAKRFAMYVVDGVVQVYAQEVGTGVCDLSGGEALLEQI